jgi:hypothetical protein
MSNIENYGGTFHASESEQVSFGRITLWHDVEETFPGGAYLVPSETYPVGTVIPGGTPINIEDDVPGGKATLNGDTPTGLSKDDRTMGSDGCTFTVVTRGAIYAKRTRATLTDAQKTHLAGRIQFTNA